MMFLFIITESCTLIMKDKITIREKGREKEEKAIEIIKIYKDNMVMRRILFVCHGNICRSQMAQSIASYLVGKNNLDSSFYFDSAATSREEIGAYMYPPAVSKLNQHRIPVVRHKARQITDKDLKSFDEIYYMDSNNLRNLSRMFSSDSLKNVHPMLDRDISDPWYTGNFDETFDDLMEALLNILDIE